MSGTHLVNDPADGSREPVVLSWSGGKDSALALARLRADPAVRVAGLLTTVTAGYDRISIHGVRRALLHEQADALGLPLHEASIEPNRSPALPTPASPVHAEIQP